jgi:hypothetical protein
LNRPGGSTNVGTGDTDVTSPHAGDAVSMRAESNLKLCVFYLKYQERVYREPTAGEITLAVVRGYRNQHKWKENFNKTMVEPVINDKDWPRTLENIWDYLASRLGVKWGTFGLRDNN